MMLLLDILEKVAVDLKRIGAGLYNLFFESFISYQTSTYSSVPYICFIILKVYIE